MTNTPTTGFRLETRLLARVDAYASHLEQLAGVPVNRTAALVKLLTLALEQEEQAMKKKRPR